MNALSFLLNDSRDLQMKTSRKHVSLLACIDKTFAPPKEVAVKKISNGKMLCDFTDQPIPGGSQPCTLKVHLSFYRCRADLLFT